MANRNCMMLDLREPKTVQIQISSDRKTVWVNTEDGCVFRASRIQELVVDDQSEKVSK